MKECNEASKTEQILSEFINPLSKAMEGEVAARYCIETHSECNLSCGLCAIGNNELFERGRGIMSLELFKKIIDKVAIESPHALVSPYHHCEPLLHPNMPEMVKTIKEHGLTCEIATNLHSIKRLKDLLDAEPDIITISVSGFYQDTYQKSHVNGDIERVKNNMTELKLLLADAKHKPFISVNYHMYKDNIGDDFDKMQEFSNNLGFEFNPSWARSINLEMTLKYLREKQLSRYHGETAQWFNELPPLTKKFYDNMNRIIYLPEDYLTGNFADIYADKCLLDHRWIHLRWNGKVSFCAWAFDDRLTAFDYLTTPIETLYEMRKESLVCKECLANNYIFYANYLDMPGIDKRALSRLGADTPNNRRFTAIPDFPQEKIFDFCKAHDHILIFGAGGNSRIITDILNSRNAKFDCYLVSDEHYSKYDNENIKPLSYLHNCELKNVGIIVALNPQNSEELRDMLEKTGLDLCFSYKYL